MAESSLTDRLTGSQTAYEYNGKMLSAKKLLKTGIPELEKAVIRNFPKIQEGMKQIQSFIEDIPEIYHDELVCSDTRKRYYINGIEIRMSHLLQPIYEQIIKKQKTTSDRQ